MSAPRRVLRSLPVPRFAFRAPLLALVAVAFMASGASAVASPPTIVALSSTSGPAVGGGLITIFGQNFGSSLGPPAVGFGPDGAVRAGVSSSTETQIVCQVPPAGQYATVPVLVIRADGLHSNDLAYSYAPPSIVSVTPSSSARSGGTLITINGTNFGGVSSVHFGALPAVTPSRASDTQLLVVAPEFGGVSPVELTVEAHGDTSTVTPFDYTGPQVTSIFPTTAPARGGVLLTITGTNFLDPAGTPVVRVGDNAAPVVSHDDVRIVCTIPPGTRKSMKARVLAGGQSSNGLTLTYDTTPVITDLRPSAGRATGGTTITIRGTSFGDAPAVTIDGLAATVTPIDDGTLEAVAPPGTAGSRNLVVSTTEGSSAPSSFEYLDPPVITSVTPSSGPSDGGTLITITGQNFGPASNRPSTNVKVGGKDVGPVRWMAPETIRCRVPMGSGGPAGVVVIVDDVSSGPQPLFQYGPPTLPSPPEIVAMNPTSVPPTGGSLVTLTGSNFDPYGLADAGVEVGGTPVSVVSVTDTEIHFEAPVASAFSPSQPTVVVVGDQASEPLTLSVAPPVISSVTPSSSALAGGDLITIFGTNFLADATGRRVRVRVDAHDIPPVADAGPDLVFNAPPSSSSGPQSLEVEVDDQVSVSFQLTYAGPEISSVTPSSAARNGGTPITIAGQSFGSPGRVLVEDGEAPALSWSPNQVVFEAPPYRGGGGGAGGSVYIEAADLTRSNSAGLSWQAPAIASVAPAQGRSSGGTLLTITGTNFGTAPEVLTNGVATGTFDRGAGRLIVMTPPGTPGATSLQVIDHGDASSSAPFQYLGPPTIAAVQPASGPIEGGSLVTVFGNNFGTDQSLLMVGRFGDLDPVRINPLSLTLCSVIDPPSPTTGPVDVSVVVDSVGAVLSNGFEYGAVSVGGPDVPRVLAFAAGPSPFSNGTTFRIALPAAADWRLTLVDARGAVVRRYQGHDEAGNLSLRWDGRGSSGARAAPGIYFARLEALGRVLDRRIVRIE